MLQKVIGKAANLELFIEDIQVELKERPYELNVIAGGWMHRTRSQYSIANHAAADAGEKGTSFTEIGMTVWL